MEDCLGNEKLANAVQELKVLLSSKNELGDKALKIPQVEECDFESDLELAFFVVGWFILKRDFLMILAFFNSFF